LLQRSNWWLKGWTAVDATRRPVESEIADRQETHLPSERLLIVAHSHLSLGGEGSRMPCTALRPQRLYATARLESRSRSRRIRTSSKRASIKEPQAESPDGVGATPHLCFALPPRGSVLSRIRFCAQTPQLARAKLASRPARLRTDGRTSAIAWTTACR